MTSNHKLTGILKGRSVTATQHQDGALLIIFDDDSTMKVKTGPQSSNSAQTGGKVLKVQQQDKRLALDFEDGSVMEIPLAEATSSVMVRDKSGGLEYAD